MHKSFLVFFLSFLYVYLTRRYRRNYNKLKIVIDRDSFKSDQFWPLELMVIPLEQITRINKEKLAVEYMQGIFDSLRYNEFDNDTGKQVLVRVSKIF